MKEQYKEKKVLRLITRMCCGGPSQQVAILNRYIPNSILIYGGLSKDEGDMEYLAEGTNKRFVKELQREINLKKDWIAFKKIYQIIKEERPDIIHTHTSKAGLLGRGAGIVFKLSHLADIKLYHTFHGNILSGYFGRIKTAIIVLVEKFLGYFTENLIAISQSQKEELLKYGIGSKKKIKVIELGLDLEKFLESNND